MQPRSFSLAVGARVVYRDPLEPALPLVGHIVEITEAAVLVRYDGRPDTASPGMFAPAVAEQCLIPEAEYYADRFAIRPTNSTGAP